MLHGRRAAAAYLPTALYQTRHDDAARARHSRGARPCHTTNHNTRVNGMDTIHKTYPECRKSRTGYRFVCAPERFSNTCVGMYVYILQRPLTLMVM